MKAKTIYRPLTATPFKCCDTYKETEPCLMLKPYIRCFWSGEYDGENAETGTPAEIVIPDTCVDIIYGVDYTDNTVAAGFSGINDRSFWAHSDARAGHKISIFAIRFYAWSAYVFSEDSFDGTLNGSCDVRERFDWLDQELRRRLAEPYSLAEIIRLTETLLMKRLEASRGNEIIDSAVHNMLLHRGVLDVGRLSRESFVSSRQLERLFRDYIGITPKKLCNLVRYQFLWGDIVCQRHFDIMNAVYEYGYTDSAHLMREFKRYHSMNIHDARMAAFQCRESF